MYKEKIIVPKGIRFIGEVDENSGERIWKDYDLSNFQFPHILNKVLTGCGYTEYCLMNDQNLVLISPRKFLLENKLQQHVNDPNIYYAENKSEVIINYERDISKEDRKYLNSLRKVDSEEIKEKRKEYIESMKMGIRDHIMNCRLNKKPIKIMVTYDSFRHVREAIESIHRDYIQEFQVVIDEFQSVFVDARFKSDAELEFVNNLVGLQKVCFVSATPMLDKYLEMLDEFKSLPYYELDWETDDPGRVVKPKLDIKFTARSLNFCISKIIQEYLAGKFDSRTIKEKDGSLKTFESKEAVFFLNSVKGICKAITTNELSPDQCNILCAKTEDNNKQVRRAFNDVIRKKADEAGVKRPKLIRGSVIGEIPLEGQPHKMFTFCTRTVYLGADFYSTCARTFIFSDSNIECLSVDISIDLEQILGRQRLRENPWKNTASMFIKTTRANMKITWKDFEDRLKEKTRRTNSLLESYGTVKGKYDLAYNFQIVAAVNHYKDDYVAVNRHAGKGLLPVFNNLMLVSEIRAFEMQQVDYADRFTVISSIQDKSLVGEVDKPIKELAKKFNEITEGVTKLKFIVALEEENLSEDELKLFFSLIKDKYGDYYRILGFSGIRSCKCREINIKKKIEELKGNHMVEDKIKEEIYRLFKVGNRYINSDIKSTLKLLYDRLGYKRVAKANDLDEYFDVKTILTPDKKHGVELLSRKKP